MPTITKTSGFGIIDQHVIELEPGQVCSYRDDKTVHDYVNRKALIQGLESLFPAKFQAWLDSNQQIEDGEIYKHGLNFRASFIVVAPPENRITIRFRGIDKDNYLGLVANKNGNLVLASVVDGTQTVEATAPGAVDIGAKIDLYANGPDIRMGVDGTELGNFTTTNITGRLGRIDLDSADIMRFRHRKL